MQSACCWLRRCLSDKKAEGLTRICTDETDLRAGKARTRTAVLHSFRMRTKNAKSLKAGLLRDASGGDSCLGHERVAANGEGLDAIALYFEAAADRGWHDDLAFGADG